MTPNLKRIYPLDPINTISLLGTFRHITIYVHPMGSLLTSRWNITSRFKWALKCSESSCTAILKLCLEVFTALLRKMPVRWYTSGVRNKRKQKTCKGDCCRSRWMVIRPKWNCHSPLLSPYKPLHVFEGLQFKRNCATTQLWLLMTCQHVHNASWYLLSWHITLFSPVKYQEILLLNFPDQMWPLAEFSRVSSRYEMEQQTEVNWDFPC